MGNNVILDSETPVTLASDEAFWIQTSLAGSCGDIQLYIVHFSNNDNAITPFLDMRQMQIFQKVESGGGPIFKVVLKC